MESGVKDLMIKLESRVRILENEVFSMRMDKAKADFGILARDEPDRAETVGVTPVIPRKVRRILEDQGVGANEATGVARAIKDSIISEEEAAILLGVPLTTLKSWRFRGTGPIYHRVRRRIIYNRRDVVEFQRSRVVKGKSGRGRRKVIGSAMESFAQDGIIRDKDGKEMARVVTGFPEQ